MRIHIDWCGPYTLEKVKGLTNKDDYGLYQIYGSHPIYGSDVLLYIGKADKQTLGARVSQHEKFEYNSDSDNLKIYTGHLGANEKVSDNEWSRQIDIAERLLIFAHKPAYNSSSINSMSNVPIESHIFNWCCHRDLMPEVSAFRYLATDDEHFSTYINFEK